MLPPLVVQDLLNKHMPSETTCVYDNLAALAPI